MAISASACHTLPPTTQTGPSTSRWERVRHWTIPILLPIVGLLLRIPFWPILGSRVAFLTFFPVVMLSAWIGGLVPGLISLAVSSALSVYFVIPPFGSLKVADLADLLGLVLFLIVGTFISWMGESVHRSRRTASARLGELEQEVSDRRRTEEGLEAARRELQQTLESISDGFMTLDGEWRIRYANHEALRMAGRPAEQFVNQILWETIPSLKGTEVETTYRRVAQERRPEHFQTYFPQGDRWIEIHAYPRQPDGIAIHFRDITERIATERRARESEESLQRFAEANVIGIIFSDIHGNIRYTNEEYLRIIGFSREQVMGGQVNWWEITPPEYRPIEEAAIATARETGVAPPYEKEYRRPDGSRVPVLIGYVLIGAQREDAVAFVLDLSERKQIERALQRANNNLEQFAHAASHDLREPLRMISAYLDLLDRRQGKNLDDSGREYLAYARDGALRLTKLLDAMQAFWQAGEDGQPVAAIDPKQALDAALANISRVVEETGAEIRSEALPAVNASEVAVTQLFQNLLSNAIKYRRPDEPVRIDLSARLIGDSVEFAVRDNGQGIRPEFQAVIFQPFRRLHGVGYDGAGMGLALCRKLVEHYGGRIWAESTPGVGSTFYFTLPKGSATNPTAQV